MSRLSTLVVSIIPMSIPSEVGTSIINKRSLSAKVCCLLLMHHLFCLLFILSIGWEKSMNFHHSAFWVSRSGSGSALTLSTFARWRGTMTFVYNDIKSLTSIIRVGWWRRPDKVRGISQSRNLRWLSCHSNNWSTMSRSFTSHWKLAANEKFTGLLA